MSRRKKWLFVFVFAPVAIVLFVAIGGEVVRLLWNWLLPALFGWPRIGFWQAIGLLALCRILFGRVGPRVSARSNIRRRMTERWARMTPEERERLRRGLYQRWGCAPPSETEPDPGPQEG